MNREIKFKAIHTLTKHWFEENEIVYHNGEWYEDWRAFEDGRELNLEQVEVIEFTGLLDKKGIEIYEGDIVRLQSVDGVDYNAQIVFKDGGFCAIDGAIDDFAVSRYNLTIFDLEITVIGNIYEHYELLERDGE